MAESTGAKDHRYSIVSLSDTRKAGGRIDAEYFQRHYIDLESQLSARPGSTLIDLGCQLDCSAFYPSITEYYNYEGVGLPFLRVNDLMHGFVHTSDRTAFLPEHVAEQHSKTIAVGQPGDIVIAKGGNTLAKVGIITDEYPRVALSRDVLILRTSQMSGNKYYVWMFLHSKYGQNQLWRSASRTGQPHLTLGPVGNIRIPRLGKEFEDSFEQLYWDSRKLRDQSIAAYSEAENMLIDYLGDVDESPDANRTSIRSLGSTFGNTGRLDAEYSQVKFERMVEHIKSKPYDRLSHLVSWKKSIEPGSGAYSEDGEGLPFVRVGNYDKFGITEPAVRLTGAYVQENRDLVYSLKPTRGTVLLSKDGSVGQAFCLQEDAEFVVSGGTLLLTVRNPETCLPNYLSVVLNSKLVQLQAQRDAGGSNILHWKPSDIEALLIPTVEREVQERVAETMQFSLRLREQSDYAVQRGLESVEQALQGRRAKAM